MDTPSPKLLAARLLSDLADQPGCPLGDPRTPPPDVFRHLADYQIHRADVARLCQVVRESWRAVVRIDCGVDHGGTPHLDIQVDPYPGLEQTRAAHRGLIGWILAEFPGARRMGLHFYPPLDPDRIRSSVTLFDRLAGPPSGADGARSAA